MEICAPTQKQLVVNFTFGRGGWMDEVHQTFFASKTKMHLRVVGNFSTDQKVHWVQVDGLDLRFSQQESR